ncbi:MULTISPECIES: WXG100 family type VII secretion target [Streptomyces]|uniref:WXG100 family type VII secretion target n=1 Tax=Streptomyces morookaense TaxID=1970 RepID=A0A7Y7EAJ0_STRMO|nr:MULTISPECIES: WXG100 family type VII secretion target [Streptomyces]MCC2280616.1 WXG100 family type VII secretion target [Streptomyces sp. ET3-23]NVK81541.1 WXG100 family type VII secretion target [Streptomyces morookaense]GHF55131.1 hypothetical protein GCM10010359_66650 [Streptomyces morookaense]
MSNIQQISDESFSKFENTLKEASAALSANLKSLVGVIDTAKAAWQGQAADAFVQAQHALNEDHDALRRLLDGIHEAVSLTRKSAHANDGDVMASMRAIDVNGAAPGGHLAPHSHQTGLSAGLDSKLNLY